MVGSRTEEQSSSKQRSKVRRKLRKISIHQLSEQAFDATTCTESLFIQEQRRRRWLAGGSEVGDQKMMDLDIGVSFSRRN